MSIDDDWLWDGSPPSDPKDVALLALAAELRAPVAREDQLDALAAVVAPQPRRERRYGLWLLAAAMAATVVGVAGWLADGPSDGWAFAGSACDGAACVLAEGQWLETGSGEAVLEVADIGTMEVAPNTRLRLVATSPEEHRLELEEGSVHAFVVAPPRLLVVETPAATAVDLGCEYDLTVLPDGSGRLEVQLGWVALEVPGRDVRVPAGAVALTRPGELPGTPWFADASTALQDALAKMDFDDAPVLATVLSEARPRDTLSLWHLLQAVPEDRRPELVARMAELTPWIQWRAIDTDALVALEPDATEDLWNELTTAF